MDFNINTFVTALGLTGAVLILVAYGLLSSGRWRATDMRYQIVNAIATAGILASLIAQWNLSSFILNVAWLVISFVGIIRISRMEKPV